MLRCECSVVADDSLQCNYRVDYMETQLGLKFQPGRSIKCSKN